MLSLQQLKLVCSDSLLAATAHASLYITSGRVSDAMLCNVTVLLPYPGAACSCVWQLNEPSSRCEQLLQIQVTHPAVTILTNNNSVCTAFTDRTRLIFFGVTSFAARCTTPQPAAGSRCQTCDNLATRMQSRHLLDEFTRWEAKPARPSTGGALRQALLCCASLLYILSPHCRYGVAGWTRLGAERPSQQGHPLVGRCVRHCRVVCVLSLPPCCLVNK
jgi:hypothetical protein